MGGDACCILVAEQLFQPNGGFADVSNFQVSLDLERHGLVADGAGREVDATVESRHVHGAAGRLGRMRGLR